MKHRTLVGTYLQSVNIMEDESGNYIHNHFTVVHLTDFHLVKMGTRNYKRR